MIPSRELPIGSSGSGLGRRKSPLRDRRGDDSGANQPPLTRVGYFHFGTNYGNPLGALESCLTDAQKRHGDIANSLIVLPEGFNLCQDYYAKDYEPNTPPNTDLKVIDDLRTLSEKWHCAFVAGLIVANTPTVSPPYNGAYLVDGWRSKLLSFKHQKDSSTNYTPYPHFFSKPVEWRGMTIVALVCKDWELRDQYPQLSDSMKGMPSVVCVPMHMTNGLGSGRPGHKLERHGLSDSVWVAANSNYYEVHSFVANKQGIIQEPARIGRLTAIDIFNLKDL